MVEPLFGIVRDVAVHTSFQRFHLVGLQFIAKVGPNPNAMRHCQDREPLTHQHEKNNPNSYLGHRYY
jgi:hypothetical protein